MIAPADEFGGDFEANAAWAFDGVIVDPSPEPVEAAGSREQQLAYQRDRRASCRARGICVRCYRPVEAGRSADTCIACARKLASYVRARDGRRPWHCGFCGEIGHNQRTCQQRIERGEPIS